MSRCLVSVGVTPLLTDAGKCVVDKDAEFALQEKAQKCERYLELLWAEDAVGRTQAEAMAAIKPENIEQAQNACLFDWVRRYP